MDWQLTTDDNGKFQMVIPRGTLEGGKYKLTASFAGDNYYTSASAEKNIRITQIPMTFSLSLTGTQVISNGDSTTITATLLGDDAPLNNAVLDYEIKHGNTTISTGTTSATDANGQTTISYTGTGAGDIDIIVSFGSYIQETFTIEDCIIYDPLTSNTGKWMIPSSCTTSYDNNGGKFGTATSYSQIKLTDKLTSPVSVEFTVVDYYTSAPTWDYPLIIYQYTNGDTTPNQAILTASQTKLLCFGNVVSGHTLLKNGVYRIEYGSSTIKIYENDVLIGTGSNNIGLPTRFEFHIGATSGRWLKLKDMKLKHEPSISLTGTSIIESGDTDTITATLFDGSTPVSGETLSYQIKHGSTVLDSGSGVTDSYGQVEIDYTGTGAGDIDIIVSYGSDIQETFVVEDCIVYRETLSTNITDLTLPPEYKVEFDIPSTSNGTYAIIGTDNTHRILMGQMSNNNPGLNGVWVYNGSSTPTQNNCPTTPTDNAHYTFTYENNSYTMSNGGSSITGTIPSVINMYNLLSSTYTPSAVRNYKIKAL